MVKYTQRAAQAVYKALASYLKPEELALLVRWSKNGGVYPEYALEEWYTQVPLVLNSITNQTKLEEFARLLVIGDITTWELVDEAYRMLTFSRASLTH